MAKFTETDYAVLQKVKQILGIREIDPALSGRPVAQETDCSRLAKAEKEIKKLHRLLDEETIAREEGSSRVWTAIKKVEEKVDTIAKHFKLKYQRIPSVHSRLIVMEYGEPLGEPLDEKDKRKDGQ